MAGGGGQIQQRFTTGSSTNGYTITSIAVRSHNKHTRRFGAQVCETNANNTPKSPCTVFVPRASTFDPGDVDGIPRVMAFLAPANTVFRGNTQYTLVLTLTRHADVPWLGHSFPLLYSDSFEATRRESSANDNIGPEHAVGVRLGARF